MGIRDIFKKATDYIKETTESNKAYRGRQTVENAEFDSIKFAEYVIAHWGGGVGGPTISSKQFECECTNLIKQCKEKNGEQFSERIYLLEMAGDRIISTTPKALRIKAKTYSYAGACTRKKAIATLTEYLKGEQWDEDLPDDTLYFDGHGVKRQDALLAQAWFDLGNAYAGEKEYDNAEKAYLVAIDITNTLPYYFTLGNFYQKTKQLDKAINLLRKAQRQSWDSASKQRITEKIKVYENLKIGVREHWFSGYDTVEVFWDSKTGTNKDYERKLYDELRSSYKHVFDKHRALLSKMDYYTTKIKDTGLEDESINKGYIEVCLEDIKLYDDLNSFYIELNKLGLKNTYEIGDGYKKGYDIFKILCAFYQKLGMFDDAINICQLSIQKGLIEDGTKGKMYGRLERLKKKVDEKGKL